MKLSKWLITFVMLVCSVTVWAKININTATLAELETLKGIGAKKAEKIIEYREKVGSFKSVEDLIHVSGIGSVTLDKIRDEIEVSSNNSSSKSKSSTPDKTDPKEQVKSETKKIKISKEDDKSSVVSKEEKQKDEKSSKSSSQEEKDKMPSKSSSQEEKDKKSSKSSNKEEKDKSASSSTTK